MSAIQTMQSALVPRPLRRTSELDATQQISRVIANETDFGAALASIADATLRVAGVLRLEVTPEEPLLPFVPKLVEYGETGPMKGRASAIASIVADGKKWGELRLFFELKTATLASPLRFAKFVAQQIGLAAVHSDLRSRREWLQRKLSNLHSVIARRKAIHRAKALLMQVHAVSEDEAFLLLRRSSYEAGRALHQVAEAVIVNERLNVPHQGTRFRTELRSLRRRPSR